MSEGIESAASLPAGNDSDGAKAAGTLIKNAREGLGMHIGALAVALKVPVRKLEALEAGELATLAGPVFVRALASSVCRHLKMDPSEVLALLPQVVSVPFSQPPELKTPFHVPGDNATQFAASQFLRKPVLAVLALLIGALVVAFWPARETQNDVEPATSQNPAREVQVISESAVVSAPVPAPSVMIAGGSNSMSPALPVSVASAPVVKSNVATSASPVIAGTASAPAVTGSAPSRPASAPVVRVSAGSTVAGENGILQFKAKDESWVEVVDAKGDAVLRRTLQAGEQANVSGVLPLKVVVGRIDVTEVSVRGRKLDMRTISKDNVGRFEVDQ